MTTNDLKPDESESQTDTATWKQIVARYQKSSVARATWQIVNTVVPYIALWVLMYFTLTVSWWLTIPLAMLAGAFLVRAFIIFHDCGHGSFFKSPIANRIVGAITGVLTFTPFYYWRWQHAVHHSTSGDLDRRGTGDVWTLTVQEYLESSRWKRFSYRIARNPIVLFVIAPLFLFLVMQRIPSPKAPLRERYSVYWTNLAIGLVSIGLIWIFGFKAFIIIQMTVLMVAGSAGIWLFYVQHQFEGVYWERAQDWDYATAALKGSSFYKLPKVLQWFSGNIGFHHIHHLSPRIPNYHLEKCHDAEPLFQTVKPVTLFSSLKSFTFRLWDEQRRKLVGYRHLALVRAETEAFYSALTLVRPVPAEHSTEFCSVRMPCRPGLPQTWLRSGAKPFRPSGMNFQSFIRTLGLIAVMVGSARAADFALKDGDRVVFYGDSITDQRLYTTFAETFVVTRFPKMNISFVHSGWGGDRVTGGGGGKIDLRLKRDVFAYNPSVMTIMLGMNDASYKAFDQGIFDIYAGGYHHIIDSVKKELPGIRITVIQPSPFDDVTQKPTFEGGYNAVLVRYSQFVKDLAGKEKLNVADLNAPVVAALEKAKATDAELSKKIIPDRVHPGPGGHLLMAAELLKSWNAPETVSAVQIDAAGSRVVAAENTKVTGLKIGTQVKWEQLDNALPMPVDSKDSVIALAVKSSDFVQTLNQQTLRVTGLAAEKHKLKIDGEDVGSFTKAQLAEGINLAPLPTPMARQAEEVHKLTLQHNNIHFSRWRKVQVPLADEKLPRAQAAIKSLMAVYDKEEVAVVKLQRAAAQPKSHKFELVAQ